MTFTVPPLPGEPLFSVAEAAQRLGCSREAIRIKIHEGVIAAVRVGSHCAIAQTEIERFAREWPSRNRGVAAHWRAYREWKTAQRAAAGAAA